MCCLKKQSLAGESRWGWQGLRGLPGEHATQQSHHIWNVVLFLNNYSVSWFKVSYHEYLKHTGDGRSLGKVSTKERPLHKLHLWTHCQVCTRFRFENSFPLCYLCTFKKLQILYMLNDLFNCFFYLLVLFSRKYSIPYLTIPQAVIF
jgi:hypothetical protein